MEWIGPLLEVNRKNGWGRESNIKTGLPLAAPHIFGWFGCCKLEHPQPNYKGVLVDEMMRIK
jgi:hypothetical protein